MNIDSTISTLRTLLWQGRDASTLEALYEVVFDLATAAYGQGDQAGGLALDCFGDEIADLIGD